MIHIRKSEAPEVLRRTEAPLSAEGIRSSVYGHRSVRQRLAADHHGKCAYCECSLTGCGGVVEHYRPKKGYAKRRGGELLTPGYYRLAYDWNNLLLSCPRCNTHHKMNIFELEDERMRSAPGPDVSRERPLLIHPALERPEEFISFRRHIAIPIADNERAMRRARHTISVLGLNSDRLLRDARREHLRAYELLLSAMEVLKRVKAKPGSGRERAAAIRMLRREAERFSAPDAQFLGMIRALGNDRK